MISSKNNHRHYWTLLWFPSQKCGSGWVGCCRGWKEYWVWTVARFLVSTPIIDTNLRMAILSFISIITLIFYIFVKNALSVIRVNTITLYKYTVLEVSHNHVMFKVFSKQLVEKVRELDSRKNQTEKGIMQFSFTFTIIPLAKAKGKHIWVGRILTFFFKRFTNFSLQLW